MQNNLKKIIAAVLLVFSTWQPIEAMDWQGLALNAGMVGLAGIFINKHIKSFQTHGYYSEQSRAKRIVSVKKLKDMALGSLLGLAATVISPTPVRAAVAALGTASALCLSSLPAYFKEDTDTEQFFMRSAFGAAIPLVTLFFNRHTHLPSHYLTFLSTLAIGCGAYKLYDIGCKKRLFFQDVNITDTYGDTPLICAAREGDHWLTRKLIQKRANLNHQNNNEKTALMEAARIGTHQTVRLLLEAGADARVRTRGGTDMRGNIFLGSSAVEEAFMRRDDEEKVLILKLFAQNIDLDPFGNTVLMRAARQNHRSIAPLVRNLAEQDTDLDRRNNSGVTALMRAAGTGNYDTVQVLLTAGANANLRDRDGQPAIQYALARDDEQGTRIVELLLQQGVDLSETILGDHQGSIAGQMDGLRAEIDALRRQLNDRIVSLPDHLTMLQLIALRNQLAARLPATTQDPRCAVCFEDAVADSESLAVITDTVDEDDYVVITKHPLAQNCLNDNKDCTIALCGSCRSTLTQAASPCLGCRKK